VSHNRPFLESGGTRRALLKTSVFESGSGVPFFLIFCNSPGVGSLGDVNQEAGRPLRHESPRYCETNLMTSALAVSAAICVPALATLPPRPFSHAAVRCPKVGTVSLTVATASPCKAAFNSATSASETPIYRRAVTKPLMSPFATFTAPICVKSRAVPEMILTPPNI
jgi:hypothetical protein